MADDPYFVEVDTNGCDRCSHGKTWCIVGPDGVAGSQSFEDEEAASDLAEAMNEAYYAGKGAAEATQIARRESFCIKCHHTWEPPPNEWAGPTYCGDCHRSALANEKRVAELEATQTAQAQQLKDAWLELERIWSDHCLYPQSLMPDAQAKRVRQLHQRLWAAGRASPAGQETPK